MAGPICTILLSKPLDKYQLAQLDEYTNAIGDKCNQFERLNKNGFSSWDFSVKLNEIISRKGDERGCVFSLHTWNGIIAEAYADNEIEESILIQMEQKIGFRPQGHIQVDAGCNGEIDHLLLGRMAFDLINKFGGNIDFGGVVLERKYYDTVKGNLSDIWYESLNGPRYYQIADRDFLENFIKDNNFRLSK